MTLKKSIHWKKIFELLLNYFNCTIKTCDKSLDHSSWCTVLISHCVGFLLLVCMSCTLVFQNLYNNLSQRTRSPTVFRHDYTLLCLMELFVVQSLSHVQLFATPWTAACQASLSITNSWSLFKLMTIELVMPFICHLVLYCPFLLLPSIFPGIRVFSNESALCIRWPKYWRFSISPSNEYPRLTSFRIDCFDLLAVQGTFKSLLQYHSSKASVLQHSAYFMWELYSKESWALKNWCFWTVVLVKTLERVLWTARRPN